MSDTAGSTTLDAPRTIGGRRDKYFQDEISKQGGPSVANGGLIMPGLVQEEGDKAALKIKVHLNLHAKVRLDLDAKIYGDVVIGLL
ncbi:hypothetical protein N7495_004476 [Penicillium taxi]|uniref:uncharacterized protein n=1 Tax=Penicillium taxi TaxID=168475 RepID=UPI002545B561|nr:uncharacterized protein N7495_004476 [Penicillium taxi]KAJ5899732.1 hypothetical protein N7495_004476 [Penicillium taxi]